VLNTIQERCKILVMTLTLACTRYFFIETLVCMDSENHVTVSLATHAIPHIFWELGICIYLDWN